MPTPYIGDPTAVQPPGEVPNPEASVTIAMPTDGDPDNASTWEQWTKLTADYFAWLLKPRSRQGEWEEPLRRYRSAALHTRALIDHLGFPMGRIHHWREAWNNAERVAFSSTEADDVLDGSPGWRRALNIGTNGNVQINPPDTTIQALHRYLALLAYGDVGDQVVVYHRAPCLIRDDNHVVLEWDALLQMPSSTKVSQMIGIGTGVISLGEGAPPLDFASETMGIQFRKPYNNANWLCQINTGSGWVTVDSFAAVGGWSRYRIEWHGANVSDDGNPATRFWVDDTMVAEDTTNFPYNMQAVPFARAENEGGNESDPSGAEFDIGPMQFAANYWASDVK